MEKKTKELKWHKLDNTAKIYPVIADHNLSGVYRVSVTLKEEVNPEKLQTALERVIGWFDSFKVRLRRGVFWYYFETNKKIPKIEEECTYPCRYIDPYSNNQFLFRILYYHNRISLEIFHALTDGYGAINFLKELVCQYLLEVHEETFSEVPKQPQQDTSFNAEDSYLKYYKKINAQGYGKEKAYQLKGEFLVSPMIYVLHGYLDVFSLKTACKKYQVSITQYLASALVYSIYKVYLHGQISKDPIKINIPVNLRQYFESSTIRNFFAVIFTGLKTEKEEYNFEEILQIVSKDFNSQLVKEHLETLISYNVSNETNIWVRMVPLFLKNIGVKLIYNKSSKGFTTTLSNCGVIQLKDEFEQYIENFHLIMGVSRKQPLKCVVCSFQNRLTFTFSSVLEDTALPRTFFRQLSKDGVLIEIESN